MNIIKRILKDSKWDDESFTWQWKDGSRSITWNVTRAIKSTSIRRPDGILMMDSMVSALKSNDANPVDMSYAPFIKPERLKQPILIVAMPEDDRIVHIIIDGWQRVYRGIELGIEVPFYFLTEEEDQQCRIYDVIYV
jgi:hypothetical protein